MTRLELTRWKPGLNTVALIDAVRTHASKSLSSAKSDVERFLAGETIALDFATEEAREAFRKIADKLGVSVR